MSYGRIRDSDLRTLFSLCRRKAGKGEKIERAGSDGKGKERTEGRPTSFSPSIVHCPLTTSLSLREPLRRREI